MLKGNPIQSCQCQTRGTWAYIPYPFCGKLYWTTQQTDPELVLAQDYWKHYGHTAWESVFSQFKRYIHKALPTAVGVARDNSTVHSETPTTQANDSLDSFTSISQWLKSMKMQEFISLVRKM